MLTKRRSLRRELRQQREHAAACERNMEAALADGQRARDELRRLTAGPWQQGQEHWLKRVLAIGGQLEHLAMDCQSCDRSEHEGCPVCREVAATGLGLSAMARAWLEDCRAK